MRYLILLLLKDKKMRKLVTTCYNKKNIERYDRIEYSTASANS